MKYLCAIIVGLAGCGVAALLVTSANAPGWATLVVFFALCASATIAAAPHKPEIEIQPGGAKGMGL